VRKTGGDGSLVTSSAEQYDCSALTARMFGISASAEQNYNMLNTLSAIR
jgi:hypothetical protein